MDSEGGIFCSKKETKDNNTFSIGKIDKVQPASQTKRLHWNEYMRNYRARQKLEQEERIRNPTIPISFNGKTKYYKANEIGELVNRYNKILIDLFNLNCDKFDGAKEIINELNNSNDYIKFSKILINVFEDLIQNSSTATNIIPN